MAGASLIFPFQWRAFWRRVLRTRRMGFYVPVLALLGWVAAVALPGRLSQAARELAAGRTASMDRLLLLLCLLWLAVLSEDLNVSLSSERLRRFPVDVRSLLTLRLFSIFLSPVAWLATVVSLLALSPLLFAPHPLLGILEALCVYALTIGIGMSVAALRSSFVRGLSGRTSDRTARRATSIVRLPGRLGPLVQREQRSVRRVLDLWIGLVLVVAAAAVSLSTSRSSTFRETIYVIVCALNVNVTLNCLGLDRPAGLTRYLILPIRGKDLVLAKNIAVMAVVAAQMVLLLAIGAWQSGVVQLVAEIVVVAALILAHLACGNIVSVFEPLRMEPHRFVSAGDPVTALVSVLIGSLPGVAVIALLRLDSQARTPAIAAIVLLTMSAYYSSLRYAGRSFERRIEIISRRLA
jgi:hypothetical protein